MYSEIIDKEIYLLPVFKKDDQIYIYSQNFFYEKWNKIYSEDLIEFILPIENIEVIQNININKNNMLNLNLKNLFAEYKNKNLALILIEDTNSKNEKIYLRANIMQKKIDKSIIVERSNLNNKKYYEKIILEVSKEIINLVKSQNLIDIRTPSFINTIISIDKKNDLVRLNKRLKKIDLINDLYVQEFNNEYVLLKIKYLGKLDKIINQLQNQQINLSLINDQVEIRNTKMNQLILKFPFKTKYYQEDFFVSSNNFSAYKLIESWPDWPGNWLNIFGLKGSGKTHLSKILEKKIKKVKIIKRKDIDDRTIFELSNIQCLIIDNFENKTDERLLYSILNQSKQYEKYVVINSLHSLKEENFNLNDLKSRINSFVFIGIELPTDDLLKVIISKVLF